MLLATVYYGYVCDGNISMCMCACVYFSIHTVYKVCVYVHVYAREVTALASGAAQLLQSACTWAAPLLDVRYVPTARDHLRRITSTLRGRITTCRRCTSDIPPPIPAASSRPSKWMLLGFYRATEVGLSEYLPCIVQLYPVLWRTECTMLSILYAIFAAPFRILYPAILEYFHFLGFVSYWYKRVCNQINLNFVVGWRSDRRSFPYVALHIEYG